MAKVCVAIGEGASEREFLTSLIQSVYGFSPLETTKYPYLYYKDDTFWYLPYPPHLTPLSGQARVVKPETYRAMHRSTSTHTHLFGENYSLDYLVLRDGDHGDPTVRERKITEIQQAANGIAARLSAHLPQGTIENWYLSGLKEDFPFFHKKDRTKLLQLLGCDTENCREAKNKLDDVLAPSISKARALIGTEVGLVFDVDQAARRSPTFAAMIADLIAKGLI